MTTDEKKTPTPNEDRIVRRKKGGGTGAFGLFVSVAVPKSDRTLDVQHSFLLAQSALCIMRRPKGNKRASWKFTPYTSHDEARTALKVELAKLPAGGVLIGDGPLLVELQSSDIENIEQGAAPGARYLGADMLARREKLDDDTWRAPDPEAK